jgi:hypothetical protein
MYDMSGTLAGGRAAAATNKIKYGADFYAKIGGDGGKKGVGHQFAHGKVDPREAGTHSWDSRNKKIPPHIVMQQGKLRWYYNIVAHNGKILNTSQKYWSKSNCVRAAKATATALGATIVIKEK